MVLGEGERLSGDFELDRLGNLVRFEGLPLIGEGEAGEIDLLLGGDFLRLEALSLTGERDSSDLDSCLGDLSRFEVFSVTVEFVKRELLCRGEDLSLREGLFLRGDPRTLGGDSESLRPMIAFCSAHALIWLRACKLENTAHYNGFLSMISQTISSFTATLHPVIAV